MQEGLKFHTEGGFVSLYCNESVCTCEMGCFTPPTISKLKVMSESVCQTKLFNPMNSGVALLLPHKQPQCEYHNIKKQFAKCYIQV